MSRRPSTLFRGSELPRLLFLAAIVLAGWPMIALFSRPRAADAPPATPPSVPVSRIAPIVPDDGVEFQALKDKAPIQVRESAAYATLLRRARETPPARLDAEARRDVFWSQLWERPSAFRGVPIHLEGTAKKVLWHDVAPSMSPTGRLYEVWFWSDENRALPYVVTIEDPPAGLVVGHELHLRATVDGYFLKLLGYQATDHLRAAPMLVGRMRLMAPLASAPAPMVEIREWGKKDGLVLIFGLLFGYILLRAFFQVRKALRPTRVRTTPGPASAGLPPDELADWLRNLPDHAPESEGDEIPPLRDGPRLLD